MVQDNRSIIAEGSSPARERLFVRWLAALLLMVGLGAALYYWSAGLTLSHYDARAHLVVARRIVDSLTPGWKQIGAVWLPLPHLLNLPIVQWEWAYRTGIVSTLLNVGLLTAGLGALGAFLLRHTGSIAAAATGPLLISLNPNVLYLQSTPMTEPLLFAFSLLALDAADRWIVTQGRTGGGWFAVCLAALTLTRYEGWFVAGALATLSGLATWRNDRRRAFMPAAAVAAAVVAFLLLSRGSTGVWFVTSGFYEVDPASYHRLGASIERVWHGTRQNGTLVVILTGLAGALLAGSALVRGRVRPALLLALLAAAALPLYAFFNGHPYRVRYMIPVVVALAALSALVVAAVPRRGRAVVAAVLLVTAAWYRPPLDPEAAMVREAQWETPYRLERRQVTAYLEQAWDGTPILASMGSLGHYMQEASQAGFRIADFLHEGNGDLWIAARTAPARYVNWVLIEERAEGGDELAARARSDEQFLAGLERVVEAGGLALYRRTRQPGGPASE